MFQVYLPIAQMSVNGLAILGLGAAVGYLAGMFGIGGGFLITPLLIFIGIPSDIAISTGANLLVATSTSAVVAQWRRDTIDFKMGSVLLAGGALGAVAGVILVQQLRRIGQFDLVVSIGYVALLGFVGSLMLVEGITAVRKVRAGRPASLRRSGQHNWIHGLPLKMRFKRSKLYISVVPPFLLGAAVAALSAMMGVGGGFIMVPAMIYLLRMPTSVVVGTSLFQIMFVMAGVTILHATSNQTVDLVLAIVLALGGVMGAQWGASAGRKLRAEQMRVLLALMVLAVAIRLFGGLVTEPVELYSISMPVEAR